MTPRMATARVLIVALLSAVPGLRAVADDAPDVRRLMSAEEYHQAGLDKLGDAEIEALNQWLLRYTATDAPVVRTSSEAVQSEIRNQGEEVIRSRIVGEFRGWSGNTVFRLENGQAWRQRRGGSYSGRASNPQVEIRKNLMGYWTLKLVESGQSTGVKRIE